LIVLRAQLGFPSFREPVASCLNFPTGPISLEMEFYTLDVVKILKRGRTVKVRCQDSNNWIVTVQCLLMSNFDFLGAQLGSPSFIELVASCLSFPTRSISLETEFYNSRYS